MWGRDKGRGARRRAYGKEVIIQEVVRGGKPDECDDDSRDGQSTPPHPGRKRTPDEILADTVRCLFRWIPFVLFLMALCFIGGLLVAHRDVDAITQTIKVRIVCPNGTEKVVKPKVPEPPKATAQPTPATAAPTVPATTPQEPQVTVVNCGGGNGGGTDSGDGTPMSPPTAKDGSQVYRQAPAAQALQPAPDKSGLVGELPDGLPDSCKGAKTGDCEKRWDALECSDKAKYWFNLGEAEMAIGRTEMARKYFTYALSAGRPCGSEYSVNSAKRLAALNLTCEYTPKSLARIARTDATKPAGNDVIDLRIRQQSLKALGHYDGPIDNSYGSATRAAIQSFQREYGFSETGDLSPIETVYLICGAAQNANDLKATTMLGIMYITGLGVVQNTDIGLRWLKTAAARGSGDLLYNLAIIYGTGIVFSSYQVCGIVENEELAELLSARSRREGPPYRPPDTGQVRATLSSRSMGESQGRD